MALAIIRPATVRGNGGWVFINGDDANVIVADGSDASSLYNFLSPIITFTFPALSTILPAGARILNVQLGLRTWTTDTLAAYADEGLRGTNAYDWVRPIVTFEIAEGGAIQQFRPVLTAIPTGWNTAVVAWPATWTDLATAPELSFNALYVASGLVDTQTFISEVYGYVHYATQPTVTQITPLSGANIPDTTRPTVTWAYTPGDEGGPQSRYQVKIYTQAQVDTPGFTPFITVPVWDSGEVISNATSVQVGINLANSVTYKAWVRVAQEVNNGGPHYSDWRAVKDPGFTISIPPTVTPARPTIIAIPEPALARVKLTVQQTTTPAWDAVTVERSNDGGVSWTAVRSADHAVTTGATFIIWDYEAGNGDTVVYRARAHKGDVVSSFSQITPGVLWSSPYAWLKSVTHPNLNRMVRFSTAPEETLDIKQGDFRIPGRKTDIVISDVRQAPTIDTLTFLTQTDAEKAALQALFDISEPLLLQPPDAFGVDGGYISCSAVKIRRPVRSIRAPFRIFETKGVKVDAPVGDIVTSTLTWQDVIDKYQTWQDVIDTFPTWADLLGTPAQQLPASGGNTGSGGEGGGTPTPPVDPSDPIITDPSGQQITDENGNLIAASNTSPVVVVGPSLYYRTDWSTGAGPWVARTSTPGNFNQYPVTNNSVHLYRPQQVTFAPAALGGIGVRIEAIWTGTQWYSGLIDTRYNFDWPMNRAIRIVVKSRATDAQGTWPSHWTKPTPSAVGTQQNIYGDFPTKGEWDLTEFGRAFHNGYGTIHMDDPFASKTHVQYPATNNFAVDYTQWHVYTSEWDGVGTFKWYLDGVLKLTATSLPHMPKPFDQRFYPTINMAMGGDFVQTPGPGNPVTPTTPASGNYFDTEYFEVWLL